MEDGLQLYRGGGHFEPRPLTDVLTALERARMPLSPVFPEERIDLIGRFAEALRQDAQWHGVAPVGALAFWLRKAAVTRMARDFRARMHPHSIGTGRGLAFHLPPQNVDTLFLYSWALSFACGNLNVVRMPERMPPMMARLLDPLVALLETAGADDLFITYPRQNEAVSRALSAVSDCRLVWGGDAKADVFNRFPLRIGGKSLMFTDRYSHAILSADAVALLDEAGLDRLAKALHDDIRLFDQKACSSPQMIHVLDGSADGMIAVDRLLRKVDALAQQSPSTDAAHGMAKFVAGCALAAADSIVSATRLSNETTLVELAPGQQRGAAVGGGFLSVRRIGDLEELTENLSARDQTLGHFGLDDASFARLALLAASHGVARLVPIGSALGFDQLWDGYDLVAELTRVVRAVPSANPATRDVHGRLR